MNILSIGNSFSQDAQYWLHAIAESHGTPLYCVNLYIGGCSLEQHCDNIKNGTPYDYEINGNCATEKLSLFEALKREKWDIVTLQQASYLSGISESYTPYFQELFDYVKSFLPNTQIYIHETWSYETNSDHPGFSNYGNNQRAMYEAIKRANTEYALLFKIKMLPVGDAIQYFRENCKAFDFKNGGLSLTRDGYHLSLLYGRYIASAVWYKAFTGSFSPDCDFLPLEKGVFADKKIIKSINEKIATM